MFLTDKVKDVGEYLLSVLDLGVNNYLNMAKALESK
jgi:hypothetical protein